MPENALVREILLQIDQTLSTIERRFEPVNTIDDLVERPLEI